MNFDLPLETRLIPDGVGDQRWNPHEANESHLKPGLWSSGLKWAETGVKMTLKGLGARSGSVAPPASEPSQKMGSSRFKKGLLAVAGCFSLCGGNPARK